MTRCCFKSNWNLDDLSRSSLFLSSNLKSIFVRSGEEDGYSDSKHAETASAKEEHRSRTKGDSKVHFLDDDVSYEHITHTFSTSEMVYQI